MSKSSENVVRERNLVAHYGVGTSDKVYMACVRWNPGKDAWSVLGKWGRRGKKLSSQVKWDGKDYGEARDAQHGLFAGKLKEGYVNVDDPLYRGPVSRLSPEIAANLETGEGVLAQVVPAPARKAKEEPEDLDGKVAVCTDNAGIECHFDKGVEYVCEASKDETMLWVWDKLGVRRECYKSRFRLVKEG
jgi:hypothetical protein